MKQVETLSSNKDEAIKAFKKFDEDFIGRFALMPLDKRTAYYECLQPRCKELVKHLLGA